MNSDFSITTVCDVEFTGRNNVPVWIKDTGKNSIIYNNCGNTNILLPFTAKTIQFINCDDLVQISTKGASQIDSLYFENCPKIDFKNLANISDLKVKRIKLVNCGIKDLSCLSFVTKTIVVEKCKNFDTVNPPENPICSVFVSNCPVITFGDTISLASLSLGNLKKVKNISLNTKNLAELSIFDCDTIQSISIDSSKLEQVSISDCKRLESFHMTNDCMISLNLYNLPAIKTYELPNRLSGSYIVKSLMTDPQINCKKRFIKQ